MYGFTLYILVINTYTYMFVVALVAVLVAVHLCHYLCYRKHPDELENDANSIINHFPNMNA